MRRIFLFLVLLPGIGGPLAADKLRDFGLDPSGRPLLQELAMRQSSIVFFDGNRPVFVHRDEAELGGDVEEWARGVFGALLRGTSEAESRRGLSSALPRSTRLESLEIQGERILIRLLLPPDFFEETSSLEVRAEKILLQVQKSFDRTEISGVSVCAIDGSDGECRPLESWYLPDPLAQYKRTDDAATPESAWIPEKQFPLPSNDAPTGALSGKDVYLNPGHGWIWRDSDYWGVQRTFVENNIEDFSNVDLVNQWLAAYCRNAGAEVFSVRELDPQQQMVIVDSDDGAPAYVESGAGWFNSSLAGFTNGHSPWINGEDPFSYGTNRLMSCTTGAPTASATWTASIPADGWYVVYASHAAYSNRSPAAHYRVLHAGGSTDVHLDQRRRRFTWIPLGRFYFEVDGPEEQRRVVLFNDSTSAGHYVSADAVRFGGGTGVISRGTAGVSGKPRFDEAARYNLQFAGAPDYDGSGDDESDGWSRRPRFGRWLKDGSEAYGAPARDSVFISSHTNAGGGHGISTFVYDGYAGTWHERLRSFVHDEVYNDLHNGYSTEYYDRGKKTGQYGENNPSNVTDEMPIFLGEWLFHDSSTDMAMYNDPGFRRRLARAIYQGIVKFWAAENGSSSTLLPEPPRNFSLKQLSQTSVLLSWDEPETDTGGIRGDPASAYRLYRGTHGRGFGPGTALGASTSLQLDDLTPGVTEYFYLTATNAGGESFPTEVLAVRTASDAQAPRLLIVSAFDKLDISTRVREPWSGSTLYRHLVHRMDRYDYIVEHAKGLEQAAPGLSFDSCEDELISSGSISLDGYDAVIWIGGIQSEVSSVDPSDDTSIDAAQQAALSAFLQAGGRLFVSGAEIAWDLDRAGGTSFVDTILHADYGADNSGVHSVTAASGGIFSGLGPWSFDDGSGMSYAVNYPDVLLPGTGAAAALEYGGLNIVEDFEDLSGWWDPNSSGQTDADAASSFDRVVTPVDQGSHSADLSYVWGSGSFIREYDSSLPSLPTDALLSMSVYGAGSQHRIRFCIRDSVDNDLFVSDWHSVDFCGWRSLSWNLVSDPMTAWVTGGNAVLDGTQAEFDSIQIEREASGPSSGHLYFDQLAFSGSTSSGGDVAAIQWGHAVVYMGFPFETLSGEGARSELMARVLDYFDLAGDASIFSDGFESGDLNAWTSQSLSSRRR